jgi:L-threonylcarbamoyladenylate synthase
VPRIVASTPSAIAEAAHILRAGGVAAFPTETVYGLGALTLNERALNLVYELKGRPATNPLIAHVLDAEQAKLVIEPGAWNDRCDRLAGLFWPGPLTLVLRKSPRVPARATAGFPTIALRSPAHPVARGLIEQAGEPISAPSANRSGRVSPTTPQHVMDEFKDVPEARDLMILDGGASEVGIESTVLDLSDATRRARILRHGAVTIEQLRAALGEVDAPEIAAQTSSPGTSAAHYSPQTPAELIEPRDRGLAKALDRCAQTGVPCAVLCFDREQVRLPHSALPMPADANEYARVMYDMLRRADALGCDRILIESPPSSNDLWRAIHDRLRRATATT